MQQSLLKACASSAVIPKLAENHMLPIHRDPDLKVGKQIDNGMQDYSHL
jgi:hypothetical protein